MIDLGMRLDESLLRAGLARAMEAAERLDEPAKPKPPTPYKCLHCKQPKISTTNGWKCQRCG